MLLLILLNIALLLLTIVTLRAVTRINRRVKRFEESQPVSAVNEYRQIQAFVGLDALVRPRRPLPPLRSHAISPDLGILLVRLIDRKRPALIVEFGGGSSTLICAYRVQQHDHGRIVSFDHDQKFARITQSQLDEHDVAKPVEMQHAALKKSRFNDPDGHAIEWFDEQAVDKLPGDIDMVIVDGPPSRLNPWIRYPALPALYEKLSPQCTVVVDDANRKGETAIVQRWLREFPDFSLTQELTEKGTAVLTRTRDLPD